MTRKTTSYFLITAIVASFALSACGIKGDLKTPPPVWGEDKPETQPDGPDAPDT